MRFDEPDLRLLVCPSRTSERGEKRDCVKEGGGEEVERVKGRAWGCDYATAVDIEVNLQRCGVGRLESDFSLHALVECRAAKTEHVRVVAMRWHSSASEVPLSL
jgi:hypothetical protein